MSKSTQKYLHNKSLGVLSLFNGTLTVPVGGKVPITDTEATHEDLIHVMRTNPSWVTIEGLDSSTAAPTTTAGITFAKDEMKGSATIPVVEKKVDATSTALGAEPKKTKKSEAAPAAA
jgi:hypothetical protein